jgi:3-oxoacyl-[acyl-carrier-protein] synthase II
MVTPLACGVEETWTRLLAGQSGAGRSRGSTRAIWRRPMPAKCKRGDGTDGTFNPDDWMEPKEQRKVDEFILYGMAAADQAVKMRAGRRGRPRSRSARACLIGSGIGGLSIADTSRC